MLMLSRDYITSSALRVPCPPRPLCPGSCHSLCRGHIAPPPWSPRSTGHPGARPESCRLSGLCPLHQPVLSVCLLQSLTSVPCHLLVPGPLASHLSDCKSFFILPSPHSLLASCSLFFPETHSLHGQPDQVTWLPPTSLSVLLPPGHLSALPGGSSHPSPPAPPSQIKLCPFFSSQLKIHPPGGPPLITCPTRTPWLSSWNCLEITYLLVSLHY